MIFNPSEQLQKNAFFCRHMPKHAHPAEKCGFPWATAVSRRKVQEGFRGQDSTLVHKHKAFSREAIKIEVLTAGGTEMGFL